MKKNKPVIQKDLKDCGVCCMQWIFIYYNGYISLEKLRDETYTTKNGTTAFHIINAFKKWNFDSLGVLEHDITNKRLKFPLIAHLILKNGLEHFVVVKNITNNTIYIMDPGIGNKKLTLIEFNKLFSGNIILVHPRSKIVNMKKNTTINNLFFKILKKEKFLLIKIIILSVIWTVLTIISSYYLKIGSSILDKDNNLLKYIIIFFSIITFFKIFVLYVREYYENHLNNLVDSYLYPEFIKHLFNLPSKSISSRSTGEIMTRVDELANIKSLFSDIFVSCFLDSIMLLLSIIILYIINNDLCFILLIFIIIYWLFGLVSSKIMYKKILENIDYQTEFNSKLTENINMFDSIKHLNITNIFLKKLEYALSKCLLSNYKFNNFFNLSNLSKDFILELCFFLINSYGFLKVLNGVLSIVDLFTFNILLSYSIEPVKNIISLLPKYNYIKASFSKIMEFMDIEEEKINKYTNTIIDGDILLKNVNYSYNNYEYILKNINFCIKNKSHVLLNGPSGSGKSTICKLICKEYDLMSGSLEIGNNNILDLDLFAIRKNILYISQNEELFFGSIKENIIAGRDIDEILFNQVCKICEIDEIISKKKMRYDSLIEPTFNNISGGEKQRIILARGLLNEFNILLLDEALSEVDGNLESKIIKNIRKFYSNKTILYISHKNQNSNFENIIELGDINGLFQN